MVLCCVSDSVSDVVLHCQTVLPKHTAESKNAMHVYIWNCTKCINWENFTIHFDIFNASVMECCEKGNEGNCMYIGNGCQLPSPFTISNHNFSPNFYPIASYTYTNTTIFSHTFWYVTAMSDAAIKIYEKFENAQSYDSTANRSEYHVSFVCTKNPSNAAEKSVFFFVSLCFSPFFKYHLFRLEVEW